MDGTTHRSGAVAALKGYLHPISVARAVMERTPHVFIVGDGAERLAREIGAKRAQNLTASSRKLWVERLAKVGETPSSVRRRTKLLPVVRKTVWPAKAKPDEPPCPLSSVATRERDWFRM